METKIYKLILNSKQVLFAFALTIFFGTAYAQQTFTFTYTGAAQAMNFQGDYIIECWGANGGTAGGGKGGYSKGSIFVSSPSTYYIYVGGVGTSGNTTGSGNILGGWNGGGDGSCNTGYGLSAGGGGGTDVRTTQNTTYANRLIVAGGGGGGGVYLTTATHTGGNGGGTIGTNGVGYSNNTYWPGQGGTQTAGGNGTTESSSIIGAGTFGVGGSHSSTAPASGWAGCGGGGGWYGGSAGGAVHSGGGGGSGYIGGVTNGITVGFGQPGYIANPDPNGNGYVVITRLCDVNVTASKNPICQGESVVLTTNAGSNIQWNTGPTSSSITVSPSSTTGYTVSGVSSSTSACSSTVSILVVVNPLPVLAFETFPTVFCAGASGSVFATGAQSYTWSNSTTGPITLVNPIISTVYTATGTSSHGCKNTETVLVNVNTNSLSVISNTTICKGSSANLTASGVNTALWSNGASFLNIQVSPSTNTVYTVSGQDALGCTLTNTVTVNVLDVPVITITPDKQTVCRGESVSLTASGGSSYVWNNTQTTTTISETLTVNVPYQFSVIGTDANNCSSSAMITVNANACTAIGEHEMKGISVFPNPATQDITISTAGEGSKSITVTDVTGKIVLAVNTKGSSCKVNIENLSSGVYHLRVADGNNIKDVRFVKQ